MPDRQAGPVSRHRTRQDPRRSAHRRRGRAALSATPPGAALACHGADYSEIYDLFYRDKGYAAEAAHVHRLLGRHSRGGRHSLLELACGTGEHAFALEALGYRIVATDLSPHMIARAVAKAETRGSHVEFRVADMRELPPMGPFDAACCLFDSLGFVETDEEIGRVLRQVNRALKMNGLFVFEFLHAPTMIRSFDPIRIRRLTVPEGELLRIAETTVDPATARCAIRFTVFRPLADGGWARTEEVHRNRALTVAETATQLAGAGFTPLEWCDGYSLASVGAGTWHVVALARKDRELEGS